MTKPTVFISYSHEDEEEVTRLVRHLKVLARIGQIDIWSDRRIGVGAYWEEEIERAMAEAEIAVLFVTTDFLISDFILGKEVPEILRRREEEGLAVYPVIAKPCPWRRVDWLAKMNVRPWNGKPVWSQDSHVEQVLSNIAEEIADIAADPS